MTRPSPRVVLFGCLLVSACDSGSSTNYEARRETPEPTFAAVGAVDHEFLPFVPGTQWIYADDRPDRAHREHVRVLPESRRILDVECSAREQLVYHDGVLTETTIEWFAQDVLGNVWLFGEESLLWNAGVSTRGEDSWFASVDHGPAMVLPAILHSGDTFEVQRPVGNDRWLVGRTDVVINLAIGTFKNCVELIENPNTEDQDLILYVRGVGPVLQQDATKRLALEALRIPR